MSETPLNFVIFGGLLMALFTGSVAVYYSLQDPFFLARNGDSFISFLCSIMLFVLGIMSRYLALIYTEVKMRPLYNIAEKANCWYGY